jgi:hypothetical protein
MNYARQRRLCVLRGCFWLAVTALCFSVGARAQSGDREDEIVANIAGGRVIVHVTKDDVITFAAIDQPIETGSIPPRVMELDNTHVGILLGASEWKQPVDPKPIRLDRNFQRIGARDSRYRPGPEEGEPDLEAIGVSFLETLRPLVAQLHHKIDIAADEPLFEVVMIGYPPGHNYGPEVWTIQYRVQQEQVSTRGDYWQTRILRPRFEQLYPPEKHAPRTIVEARYPESLKAPTIMEMIQGNDPRVAQLRGGDPRFGKVIEAVDKGQAQKAVSLDATDFMRALLPLVAGKQSFILATMDDEHGMRWIVTPSEPVEKVEKGKEDKDRPAGAPTLRKRPDDN